MPRRLGDDCLEYEACVRSHTAHNKFKLDGEVPQTIITGETIDISQFCELSWYEWVKFCSTTISFPEDLLVLRKYLGLSIDISPAMTTKILTPMGKVVHCSTYRLLMPKELADPVEQDRMNAFLGIAEERWGNCLVRGQLEEVGLIDTPNPQPYLDNQQTDKTFPAVKEEVTPKAGDEYIQASIMIPHSNTFARGTVVSHKCKLRETSLDLPMTIPF